MTAKKKGLICITKKNKEDKQYVICFKDKKKSSPKKTKKKNHKSLKAIYKPKKSKKRSIKYKLSQDKYIELIEKKKKKTITKKENKLLDDELFKKYCKCIKTIKRSKNKSPKSYFDKYGICMNSLYKNRKFKPPYNVSKKCNIFYS